MTLWLDHKTKILGTLTTLVAGLLSLIALGMFDATATDPALLSSMTIRWLTIICSLLNMVLGGGTIAAGLSNSTRERIAASKATVATAQSATAQAMENALNTEPPNRG